MVIYLSRPYTETPNEIPNQIPSLFLVRDQVSFPYEAPCNTFLHVLFSTILNWSCKNKFMNKCFN